MGSADLRSYLPSLSDFRGVVHLIAVPVQATLLTKRRHFGKVNRQAKVHSRFQTKRWARSVPMPREKETPRLSMVGTLALITDVICWMLAGLVIVVTVLPMSNAHTWWIRLMDFPRLQIAIIAGVISIAALFIPGSTRLVLPALMAAACCYQLWRIYPYTPFAAVEMTLAPEGPDTIKVLSANVLMENRQHGLLLQGIEQFDPDILLLMETDQIWVDAVEPALARYSTVIREPKSDHYGMVFATRLPADDVRIVRLTSDDTPSVFAQMTAPDGTVFRFVGLHPQPPVPGQNTHERDAQIFYAALFAQKSNVPVVVTGDFNDVVWSATSRTFKHVGRYLDPRIGRGFFASFDAEKFYLRFPIDQLFVTEDVAMVSIERLAYIGSDHFPMAAKLRVDAELAARFNVTPEPVSDGEQRLIDESMARTRVRLGAMNL